MLSKHLFSLSKLRFQGTVKSTLGNHTSFSLTNTPLTCLRQYQDLRSLQLGPLVLFSYADLGRFLLNIPHLKHLDCTNVRIVSSDEGPEALRLRRVVRISHLAVRGLNSCI